MTCAANSWIGPDMRPNARASAICSSIPPIVSWRNHSRRTGTKNYALWPTAKKAMSASAVSMSKISKSPGANNSSLS